MKSYKQSKVLKNYINDRWLMAYIILMQMERKAETLINKL